MLIFCCPFLDVDFTSVDQNLGSKEENVVDISSQKSFSASFTCLPVDVSLLPKMIISPDQKIKSTHFFPNYRKSFSCDKTLNEDILPDINWIPMPGAFLNNWPTMYKALQDYSAKYLFTCSRKCSYYNKA